MPSKYKFFFTPLALSDIEEALSYIKENLSNPIAAINLLSQIEETIDRICSFPLACADCSFFMPAGNTRDFSRRMKGSRF